MTPAVSILQPPFETPTPLLFNTGGSPVKRHRCVPLVGRIHTEIRLLLVRIMLHSSSFHLVKNTFFFFFLENCGRIHNQHLVVALLSYNVVSITALGCLREGGL